MFHNDFSVNLYLLNPKFVYKDDESMLIIWCRRIKYIFDVSVVKLRNRLQGSLNFNGG